MVQAPQGAALSGPTLIRLLARLTDLDVPESGQSLSDRLSQWLGWTDAIALSSALNGNPPAAPSGARGFGSAEEDECARVRASLAKAIAGERAFAASGRRAHAPARPGDAPMDVPADYPTLRQRYLSLQQTMDTDIGLLRGRLRNMLVARGAEQTRLAVVDAVMERVLGARERTLLSAVPEMLGGHFERLRQAEQKALADAEASGDAAPIAPGAWLDAFRSDARSVLLAELDIRLQPVEGLLAALRAR
ncbi:DUF3348 domain-containing protein [Burkholderia alba]|uniref:DUF3348 domain-containing protein n=1 Tax=Burkholderia alba TaxID=2683677 RepID=UPI002B0559FC|nr:DUF3348 domain-containing protein [Burkholderia alba]